MQRVDDDARIRTARFLDDGGCLVERAHARPGDELEVDRQTKRFRESAELGEEFEDVRPVIAPGAAQHVASAELGGCLERVQITTRRHFLDDACDFDIEQPHAGGRQRRLGASEQRAIGAERIERFVRCAHGNRPQADKPVSRARGGLDELWWRHAEHRQMCERERRIHALTPGLPTRDPSGSPAAGT